MLSFIKNILASLKNNGLAVFPPKANTLNRKKKNSYCNPDILSYN